METKNSNESRREFIKNSVILGTGLIFFKPSNILANENKGYIMNKTVLTKGYAAFDESGILKPWTFERRPVGDDDILIEIKAASICHSDIHT